MAQDEGVVPSSKRVLDALDAVEDAPVAAVEEGATLGDVIDDLDTDPGPPEGSHHDSLSRFSAAVCAKLEAKGALAGEHLVEDLVRDVLAEKHARPRPSRRAGPPRRDEGRIRRCVRRRTSDVLDVLAAMDIVSRTATDDEVVWNGLPKSAQEEVSAAKRQRRKLAAAVSTKRRRLEDLLHQHASLVQLATRNGYVEATPETTLRPLLDQTTGALLLANNNNNNNNNENGGGNGGNGGGGNVLLFRGGGGGLGGTPPHQGGADDDDDDDDVLKATEMAVPFIVVKMRDGEIVKRAETTEDGREVFLDFSGPFEIACDTEILRRLFHKKKTTGDDASGETSLDDLAALVPSARRGLSITTAVQSRKTSAASRTPPPPTAPPTTDPKKIPPPSASSSKSSKRRASSAKQQKNAT